MNEHPQSLHGYYLDDLEIGQSASYSKSFTSEDVADFARVSGDDNPLHLNAEFAASTRFETPIIHGMLTTSLWSTIVGTLLPGPGCAYMSQSLKFYQPVRVGEKVEATLTITEIDHIKQRVHRKSEARVGDTLVAEGESMTWVPRRDS